ncbi:MULTISPECIES: enoyl-CoA hydratase/isomerase family protein [Neobacillus]|uniref:Enoyl-CoA hydratase/isomerase family protein n=1 Tax=Neobacillus rhizophilus TaxID=2833579 RepID=A0A942U5Q9_9BACI|nr:MULTISPECIES: enoyl-CoA hydratase/isomerase family protein [Neobacillus]MBS4215211.1 enoyl-CoA hydratase/isomerase family protein [Neobacillus rhizophilus]MBU8919337.1 enoyl-CoA hydratase/isomerase family protein [Bacillus sp. FJAT-29953]
MKDYQTISVEWRKPVLKVTFNRPDKANAMNKQMNEELDDIITEVRKDTDYKFIVFTGNGKTFSAGADMNEVLQGIESNSFSSSFIREDQITRHEFLRKFDALDQITIAAINGPMYGAGLALAMVCDFRIMADNATACLPEVERGLFFSGGGTPRLVNLIGPAKAKEFIMLCEAIDASEALKIGLVNKVVPLQELTAATEELIGKLSRSPFSPIRLTKKIVNAATPRFENLLFYEPELQEQMMLYGEAREEIDKFVSSKRK